MKSVFENFENFTTCCDAIVIVVPNFREMAQNMFQIPILVSVRLVVLLFHILGHFPKIGHYYVTGGGKILKIFKN